MFLRLFPVVQLASQVTVWCREESNHYLNERWQSSLTLYVVVRPHWVNRCGISENIICFTENRWTIALFLQRIYFRIHATINVCPFSPKAKATRGRFRMIHTFPIHHQLWLAIQWHTPIWFQILSLGLMLDNLTIDSLYSRCVLWNTKLSNVSLVDIINGVLISHNTFITYWHKCASVNWPKRQYAIPLRVDILAMWEGVVKLPSSCFSKTWISLHRVVWHAGHCAWITKNMAACLC